MSEIAWLGKGLDPVFSQLGCADYLSLRSYMDCCPLSLPWYGVFSRVPSAVDKEG